MDEMPSAEFRKVYAKLRESVDVTVNGHVIGRWIPVSVGVAVHRAEDGPWTKTSPETHTLILSTPLPRNPYTEFRPAPKPGQRK